MERRGASRAKRVGSEREQVSAQKKFGKGALYRESRGVVGKVIFNH